MKSKHELLLNINFSLRSLFSQIRYSIIIDTYLLQNFSASSGPDKAVGEISYNIHIHISSPRPTGLTVVAQLYALICPPPYYISTHGTTL